MNRTEIFNHIFETFNNRNVNYVIIHSYQCLPDRFDSDIDTAIDVSHINDAIHLLDDTLSGTDWRVVQYWRHENYAADCVISNGEEYLQVDFCSNYERNGRVLMDVKELIDNRFLYKNFYVPTPQTEYVYILLKKLLKKKFSDGSKKQLPDLWSRMENSQKQATEESLLRFMSEETIRTITSLIAQNRFEEVDIRAAWDEIFKATSNPMTNLEYKIFDFKRRICRILHPTGLFVVFLGVDGAGKTTICNQLEERYKTAFRKIKHYHSRVRLLKDLAEVSQSSEQTDSFNPHGKKKKAGKLLSAAKFGYYFLDFLLGNLVITKAKIKSSLVVIERYYYDYIIDKVRYNLNLSDAFLNLFGIFIKKPDLIIILTGDAEKLCERKHEITVEEIEKQKARLNALFCENPKAVFIDTVENGVDTCVNQILRAGDEILRNNMMKALGKE